MADIAKPQIGKRGWNIPVDALFDRVNAHDTNPILNANTTGAAVGSVPAVTQVDGAGNPTAFGLTDQSPAKSLGLVDVRAFGVDTTGAASTSATVAALQAAVAASGGLLYLPAGTYNVTAGTFRNVKRIIGAGRDCTVLRVTAGDNTRQNVLTFGDVTAGLTGSSYAILDAKAGDRYVKPSTPANAGNFAVGDAVALCDTTVFDPLSNGGAAGSNSFTGFIAHVIGFGSTLMDPAANGIDPPLYQSYAAAVAGGDPDPSRIALAKNVALPVLAANGGTIRKVSLVDGVELRGLTIKGAPGFYNTLTGGTPDITNGALFQWCRRPVVRDVHVEDLNSVALVMSDSIAFDVDISARRMKDNVLQSQLGYAVQVKGMCSGGSVRVDAEFVRHAFTTEGNYAAPGFPIHCTVSGRARGMNDNAFDTHNSAYGITFDGIYVEDGPAGGTCGVQSRSPGTVIRNATIMGCRIGVHLARFSDHARVESTVCIVGGQPGQGGQGYPAGILIWQPTAGAGVLNRTLDGITIDGPQIVGCPAESIVVDYQVSNLTIRDPHSQQPNSNSQASATAGPAHIRFTSRAQGSTNVAILGGHYDSTALASTIEGFIGAGGYTPAKYAVAVDSGTTFTGTADRLVTRGLNTATGEVFLNWPATATDQGTSFQSETGPADTWRTQGVSAGESTLPRAVITGGVTAGASGRMHLSYFTAGKSETVGTVRINTHTPAAAATPTLCRFGVYEVAADESLTLVASTPNDTSLFAAAFASYTKALTAPFRKIKGRRYAVGVLVVSAAAVPSFFGNGAIGNAEAGITPRLGGTVSSLTDLPSTVAAGSVTNTNGANLHYVVLQP